jgi:arylsulfatase A-like enzyme
MCVRWKAVLICAALLLPVVSCRSSQAVPRNLIVITLDTMRADRLAVYGFSGGVSTPALDRVANEGTVFEEAFASVPLTLPSHASIFTGLYPPRLKVRDNAGAPLSGQFTTLAETLHQRGVRTGAFVASAVLASGRGLEQGFDVYSLGANRCPGVPSRRRGSEVVDEALAWLNQQASEPFFTWIHLFVTHRPYDLPGEFKDSHFDTYLAAIRYEDAQVARVIRHLESREQLDSTLIVVVGDHGESLGGHGEDGHGMFLYQEALRVPFMMRGPGVPVQRSLRIARLVDLTPTVLDLFRIQTRGMDGTSLLRTSQLASEVYAESMYPLRFGWAPLRSLRADRYKFIDAPRPELYDLETDPAEERNIVDAHPSVAEAMRRRLRAIDSEEIPSDGNGPADPAVIERLASLGYIGSASASDASSAARQADPKDRIGDFNRMTTRQWQTAEQRRALCR